MRATPEIGDISGSNLERAPKTSPTRTPRRRWLVRLAVLLVLGYAAWCAALYALQDRMLFPGAFGTLQSKPAPAEAVVWEHPVDDGAVHAWFIPAPNASAENPAPLVVLCHGNYELICSQGYTVQWYRQQGCSVLLPEYRGFGGMTGYPSESGIVDDAVAFLSRAKQLPTVDARRVVIHGRSLGGGVAAALAQRCPPAALILESTFTSIEPMARARLAPGWLVKNPFHTDRVLSTLDVPTLILHGDRDEIIPVEHGRKLHELARNGTYAEFHAGHNDLVDSDEPRYWQAITDLLNRAKNPKSGQAKQPATR